MSLGAYPEDPDDEEFPPGEHPLDNAPELDEWERPAWDAYHWLMRWADGWGGLSIEALREWFRPGNPGARLEPAAREFVKRAIPLMAQEDRKIQKAKAEADRKVGKHRK